MVAALRSFLGNLGFESEQLNYFAFGKKIDEHGELVLHSDEDINTYVDEQFTVENDVYMVDVIVGSTTVFLIISYRADKQESIAREIENFFTF